MPTLAIEPPDDVQCTEEEEKEIWNYLLDLTKNPASAAGIMGNLFYESHLYSKNLETMGKKKPDLGELSYTQAVDMGIYKDFVKDKFGYGLAQWTYSGRKKRLLEIAEEKDGSIGDLDVQLQLIGEELEKYHMLHRISSSTDINFTAEYFLKHFENPSNQSEKVIKKRQRKAKYFYNKFAYKVVDLEPSEAQEKVANIAAFSDAYGINFEKSQAMAWASGVYEAAGFQADPCKTPRESAEKFGVSDNLQKIPVGAAVYGHASSKDGHIGIYVGDNQVYHNIDGIQVDTLEDWIVNYRGYGWGWIGGTDLSEEN